MSCKPKMHRSFDDWPVDDQAPWLAAFKSGDRFDDSGPGAHLAESTRKAWRAAYGRFIGYIATHRPELLGEAPNTRIDRLIVGDYVAYRRKSCSDVSIAIDLDHLRGALKLICPDVDWSWLLTITRRIAAMAPRRPPKYQLITSERLYALGLELMDGAVAAADAAGHVSKVLAFDYRDGLIIALTALIAPRRRTLGAMRIGKQLIKIGDLWSLDIPAADTKSRRALDFPIAGELGQYIDVYLDRFRSRIPGTDKHASPWASNRGRPMCAGAIYDAVCRRTRKAFGFPVNLHRFRHAAASLWSVRDPANVRGVKDLLGQSTFGIADRHYIMGQSRVAGRVLARIVDNARESTGIRTRRSRS